MTALAHIADRPLSVILAELMLAEGELKRLNDRFYAQGNFASELDERRSAALDDTIWLRRDEAKAAIERLTGVSWDMIEGANL